MRKIVISLGGSTIVQEKINVDFILKFKEVIRKFKDDKFVIVVGGGKPCRMYMDSLGNAGKGFFLSTQIGVYYTYLNASLVEAFFSEDLNKKIFIPRNYEEFDKQFKENKMVFTGGIIPGSTTDGTAVEIAERIKADFFVNLTDVEGLYDKDPKTAKDAKFISKISHKEFNEKFISKIEHKFGQHFILDIKAANIAKEHNIKVIILKGLNNLEKCLNNQKFIGTIIG